MESASDCGMEEEVYDKIQTVHFGDTDAVTEIIQDFTWHSSRPWEHCPELNVKVPAIFGTMELIENKHILIETASFQLTIGTKKIDNYERYSVENLTFIPDATSLQVDLAQVQFYLDGSDDNWL